MNRYLLATLMLLCSPFCQAAITSAVGTVALMRDNTLLAADGRVQGVLILQLSVPLSGGCNWVWISSADKLSGAFALSAKLSGASVTIWYDPTVPSPWGEIDVCGITGIDFN